MRKANIRTLSGVAIVTSLTEPHPCPGNCVYCPEEKKMPKSYLASEPAAARALALKFDPYAQMQKRIEMLNKSGHPTDKIEYIIKGGTWNAYPLKYQFWYILQSFKACNDLSRKKLTVRLKPFENFSIEKLKQELESEQDYNDKLAKHKIVGLTLETRPDAIIPKTMKQMRLQGCTRIELGLQAPDDDILKTIKRGHTVERFKQAVFLLRQAGFKVDLHFMPDLPGSDSRHDVAMYKLLFSDPGLKPDMVKIYPCTVIKSARLHRWYQSGMYKPYGNEKLLQALIEMKLATPRYCRISRLVRDIPDTDIKAGNKVTNLREQLKREMNERGLKCRCLRCREIGHQDKADKKDKKKIKSFFYTYQTRGGKEYFLSFEDNQRQAVFAFLRLRIPAQAVDKKLVQLMPEINNCAFIRELHVYGQLVELGTIQTKASQHHGLGKKLVEKAEQLAKKSGFSKIAVISGVGVRKYYRKLGYRKQGTYMVKKI